MKFYKKFIVLVTIVLASSCTLDLQQDPNAVQPDQVLANLILNNMQRQLAAVVNAANTSGAEQTRLLNGAGAIYQTATNPQTFDFLWTTAYAGILQDADQLIALADKNGFARHAGMARVIQAYTLILLTDMFGDVPFTEAFKGASNFNPKADAGSAIYDIALERLDKAKEDFTTTTTVSLPKGYLNPVAPVPQDQYYGNSYNKWVRLANSIKLKAFLNLSLREPDRARVGINAIISDPNAATNGFITTQSENFVWRYGTTSSDPDGRHPRFTAQYPGGGGDYQSNWLMWHMFYAYNATQGGQPGDPRMRFYFYRQVTANSSSSNEIRCLTESRPDHYPSSTGAAIVPNSIAGLPPMGEGPLHPTKNPASAAWGRTFCQPTDRGYWGRDHVDPQGIPPDGLLRTAYGPYPVGGRFDNNAGASIAASQGMRGAGIQPIMMRSFVKFMLAEATLTLGVTSASTAVQYYTQGIDESFTDVRDWAVNGTYGTTAGSQNPDAATSNAASPTEASTINTFYPAAAYIADVANYRTSAVSAFNSSPANALNYLAREYWIALVGNGYEAYNLYRRTGRPTGMQPVINPSPGPFPQSFWYPAVYANLNNTARQKADLTTKVFWQVDSPPNINF